jgi:hypothetical protein
VWRSSGFVFTFAHYVLKLLSCSEPSEEDSFRWYFTLSELSPDEHFTGKDIV